MSEHLGEHRREHRFMFTPFWKLTQWGFLRQCLRPQRGGDGVYPSRFVIVPLVGEFCWFDTTPDPDAPDAPPDDWGPEL